MSFNNNRNSGSQFSGFLIAAIIVGIIYFFFYNKQKDRLSIENNNTADIFQDQQPNALQNFEQDEQHRQELVRKNTQPFLAKVMLRYSDDGSVKGPMQLTPSFKKDAVFIIRNKLNNAIMAIVQVPRGRTEKIELPIGEYSIEYAEGDGAWQGLGEFWGYGTHFNKSRLTHNIYQEIYQNGRTIHGTGIILDVEDGTVPDRISKKQFVSD